MIRKVGRHQALGKLRRARGRLRQPATPTRTSARSPPPTRRPKPQQQPTAHSCKSELEMPPRDPAPDGRRPAPASQQRRRPPRLRRQAAEAAASAPGDGAAEPRSACSRIPAAATPTAAGGDQQLLGTGTPVAGYATFDDYISQGPRPAAARRSCFKRAEAGRAGDRRHDPRAHRQDRPAARARTSPSRSGPPAAARPQIDPKPILDGWKLLEATAIYRASGKNPFWGRDAKNPSIGQILLMSKAAARAARARPTRASRSTTAAARTSSPHIIDRRVARAAGVPRRARA